MSLPQSSFIIKRYEGFGGNFVDSQYLGASFDAGKPHVFQGIQAKIYSSTSRFGYFTAKAMLGTTSAKSGGYTEIDSEIYRWRLQDADYRAGRSVELVETSSTPGLNGTTFRIKLDIDYYQRPDVLFPEDNEFPIAIIDGPVQDGVGYVYTCRLQTDRPDAYLNPKYLQPGRQFVRVWTSVQSEMNSDFGTQQSPSSFMLEAQVGTFAHKITVTDKAMREQGRLGITFLDSNGKSVEKFLPYFEAKMWEEFYLDMERQLIYGKRSHVDGPKGYWIKTGAGLRQQLQDSWIEYYSGALTTTRMQDYLMNIFFSRESEQNRAVSLMTGTLGSVLFHKAMVADANGLLNVDTLWQEKIGSTAGVPNLAYGAQYTRYRGIEGIVIDLVKNPMYDSTMYCKIMHPDYPEFPIDSARMTFLDYGMSSATGTNNIQMLRVKDTFVHGMTRGLVGPEGPTKGGYVNGLQNSYDVGCQGTAGLWIVDVTRAGELIYAYED